MIILLTLFSFFTSEILLHQDSIQIVTYYDQAYPRRVHMDYWVLSSDTTTKTGPYKVYFKNGSIYISGLHNRGVRVGRWYFYDVQTNEPFIIYDFETNKEILYKPTHEMRQLNIQKYPYSPQFLPNSLYGFWKHIVAGIENKNIKNRIDSDCYISLTIVVLETGELKAEPDRHIKPCDENILAEVIEMIENSPKWYPMVRDGSPELFRMGLKELIKKNSD